MSFVTFLISSFFILEFCGFESQLTRYSMMNTFQNPISRVESVANSLAILFNRELAGLKDPRINLSYVYLALQTD